MGATQRIPESPAEAGASEPEFRAPQRARLVLQYREQDEDQHSAQTGWARIDGPWVHWLDDGWSYWQSWPMAHVLCIDWSGDE